MNKIKFTVHGFDAITGVADVEFINPHGPIETGARRVEDFDQVFLVWTGNRDSQGNKIMSERRQPHPNPNDNIRVAIHIPVINGAFIAGQLLLDHIAASVCDEQFRRYSPASNAEAIEAMIGSHEVSVVQKTVEPAATEVVL